MQLSFCAPPRFRWDRHRNGVHAQVLSKLRVQLIYQLLMTYTLLEAFRTHFLPTATAFPPGAAFV